MQISILLLKQIVQLFLMILMGYIMIKIKFLKEEDLPVIIEKLVNAKQKIAEVQK